MGTVLFICFKACTHLSLNFLADSKTPATDKLYIEGFCEGGAGLLGLSENLPDPDTKRPRITTTHCNLPRMAWSPPPRRPFSPRCSFHGGRCDKTDPSPRGIGSVFLDVHPHRHNLARSLSFHPHLLPFFS